MLYDRVLALVKGQSFQHALCAMTPKFISFSSLLLLAFSVACDQQSDSKQASSETTPETAAPAEPKAAEKPAPAADIPVPADVAAPPADSEKTESGLMHRQITAGSGSEHPTANDKVMVHYSGWTTDGKMFDSSKKRGQPITFPLKGVIKGWTEGVQLMVEGETRRFWIPGDLAYGDVPRRPGAPAGQLTFDIELIKIVKAPKPPETPKDVAAAPADAKKTKSGLAYKILKSTNPKGKMPVLTDTVTCNYSGWTTDGKMFDSSVTRDRPLTIGVSRVIKGWTEGLQLMKEGDSARFWIPAELAYGEKPMRGPAGALTFDVDLISIRPAPAPPKQTQSLPPKGK